MTAMLTEVTGFRLVGGVSKLPESFGDVFRSQRISAGALNLHAVVGGEGPPLLLLGGWPQSNRPV